MGYSRRNWVCPFFVWDEKKRVHCEAGRIDFKDREGCARYADQYCGNVKGWEGCTLAASLAAFYARNDKNDKNFEIRGGKDNRQR